jgi:hypothetical protein
MGVPDRESGSRSRERTTKRVIVLVRVAEIGRTHRAYLSPGVRKVSWRNEGASPEEAPSFA